MWEQVTGRRNVNLIRRRSITRLSDGWSGEGGRFSVDLDTAELQFPAADMANRQVLPLASGPRADLTTLDRGPFIRGRHDTPTKVRPLCGSSTAAVRPVVRGTRSCRMSGLPLPLARSGGCRSLDDSAPHGNAQGNRLPPIAALSPRRRSSAPGTPPSRSS